MQRNVMKEQISDSSSRGDYFQKKKLYYSKAYFNNIYDK